MARIPLREYRPELFEQVVDKQEHWNITHGSKKKIRWHCPEHPAFPYICAVGDKTRKIRPTKCAICNGKQVVTEYNSFAIKSDPELVAEYCLDNEFKPEDIVWSSKRTVKWQCSRDERHVWKCELRSRTQRNWGCPYCSNNRVSPTNNFAVLFPEQSKEWDYSRNTLRPEEVTYGSETKVWWKCSAGHSWQTTPNKRSSGYGCKQCSQSGISKLEGRIADLLEAHDDVSIEARNKKYAQQEVDICFRVNDKQIFLEVDGGYWHRNKFERDTYKTLLLLDLAPVIRIRTDGLNFIKIKNDRLLQLDWTYSFDDGTLVSVVEQILNFARAM